MHPRNVLGSSGLTEHELVGLKGFHATCEAAMNVRHLGITPVVLTAPEVDGDGHRHLAVTVVASRVLSVYATVAITFDVVTVVEEATVHTPVYAAEAGKVHSFAGCPLELSAIVITFAGAGSAYIQYE